MNISKLLKFVQSLPEAVRCVLYVIYLLTYFLKSMKTFFVPKREKFVPADQLTSIPRETPSGIIHEIVSDKDILDRYSSPNAIDFDPVNLASNGITPPSFIGSVVSPLDATERLVDSFDESYSSISNDDNSVVGSTFVDGSSSDKD